MSKAARQRITLVIAIILTGGLAAAYFYIGHQQEMAAIAEAELQEEEPAFQLNRLIDQSESSLMHVTFVTDEYSFTIMSDEDEGGRTVWQSRDYPELILNQADMRNMMRDVFLLNAADTLFDEVENPEDFGIGQLVATAYFDDGSVEVIRLGNQTPDHTRFYVMVDGDPALHIINAVSGNRLTSELRDLIEREVSFVDTNILTELIIAERGRASLDFGWDGTEEELEESLQQFGMTWLTMKAPFPGRDLNFQNLQMNAFEYLEFFRLIEVIEVFPADLAVYGLDDPSLTLIFRDAEDRDFILTFGDVREDGNIYLMYSDLPHVFIADYDIVSPMFGLNPFTFIDRFIALVNIVDVDSISISGAGYPEHYIIINNFEDEDERPQIAPIFNGQEVNDRGFRIFYQALIAIMYEQDIGLQENLGRPDLVITFNLSDPAEPPTIVEFFSYDANFYAVRQYPHPVQFVTSKRAVSMMFDSAESLLAGELTGR